MDIKRLYSLILCAAAAAFLLVFAPSSARAEDAPDDAGLGIARVSYMTGDVLFNNDDDADEWAEVSPNFSLRNGDRLWVGDDSRLELRFIGGETAWANYQSELDIISLSRDSDGDAYQLALPFGEASFSVANYEVLGSVFQVDTPQTSVRAFGKALFRISSLSDSTTQVGVADGSVEVESEYGVANIRGGEMIEVYADGRSRIMDLPATDSWDDWVDSRQERYARAYRSDRYLPREMHDYADEFDQSGRWVSYPEYGHVWVPAVDPGWSPYSNGRWVWSGWDYVWMPYDPWYAPFHYGRWSWTVSFGWCWIPPAPAAVFWSPGYVGWVWDADYVYWVPLAPGDVYYGHGRHHGPHSVNIYQTTVIVNKNVYKNSRAKNGVVVVGRDSFLKGKTVKTVRIREEKIVRRFKEKVVRKEIVKEKIVREEVTYGASPARAIKPIKESRHPRPDRVVKAERMPQKVVERKKFERERKVVKGKVKSAFTPEQKPRHMKDLERITKPEYKRNGREKAIEQRERTRTRIKEERTIKEAAPERTRENRNVRERDMRERDKGGQKEQGGRERGRYTPEPGPSGTDRAPAERIERSRERGGRSDVGADEGQGGGAGMSERGRDRGDASREVKQAKEKKQKKSKGDKDKDKNKDKDKDKDRE